MLASTPSQHLESDFRPSRNPTNESTFRNRALGAYQRCPLFRGGSHPNWPDIVDAANWLRHDLGVSKSLWDKAYLAIRRVTAAAAIAIVSGQGSGAFPHDAGQVVPQHGAQAKTSELNPNRSLCKTFGEFACP